MEGLTVTSGRAVTADQAYQVRRMASYKDDDGNWMYSYEEIASRLHMDPRTVSQCVREGSRRWHLYSRWRKDFPDQA